MPRVSVLLPCRDARATLSAAVGSLLGQTYTDLELVVVDDASTDGTRGLLHALAERDPRVRVLENPAPLGVGGSLARAAGAASGELLVRADADDVSRPDRVARQVDLLDRHPEVDVVASRLDQRSPTGLPLPAAQAVVVGGPELVRWSLLAHNVVPHASVAMRAAFLDRAGGYDSAAGFEDYDLWLRTWGWAKVLVTPTPLVRYRRGPASATGTDRLARHRSLLGPLRRCWQAVGLEPPGDDALALLLDPLRAPTSALIAATALDALAAWLRAGLAGSQAAEDDRHATHLRTLGASLGAQVVLGWLRSGPHDQVGRPGAGDVWRAWTRLQRRAGPRALGTAVARLGTAALCRLALGAGGA